MLLYVNSASSSGAASAHVSGALSSIPLGDGPHRTLTIA
eukprot:COSAG06_NODE_2287_length_7155_cov_20.776927_5_plen_39_part_00